MIENLLPLLFMVLGVIALARGIHIRRGYEKARYFSPSPRQNQIFWSGIPLGIAFITWGLAFVPSFLFGTNVVTATMSVLIFIAGFVILLIGFLIILFIKPNALKPEWLQWLEREHGDMIPLLRREAREMGLDVWKQRIETQEDLEEWVAEVEDKYRGSVQIQKAG